MHQSKPRNDQVDVSIVIPMLNEEDNVVPLYEEICQVMPKSGMTWELIFVDDGSKDDTVSRLERAVAGDRRVTIVELSRRFGQTAALAAGFRRSTGQYIVPMDADMQNDPRDIVRLVQKLVEPPGYDVVSGWRKKRHDNFLTRRVPSILANWLVSRLTWTRIHDFGCTLKAYRREALEDVQLYGEMHRFLPAICHWRGARIGEEIVNHRPRAHGTTKYDLRRTVKVLLDLITVKFLGDYLIKPIYFFGKLGIVSVTVAFVTLALAIFQKFGLLIPGGQGINLNRNVLVLFAMMMFILSVILIMMGLLSELLVRIYHESQDRLPYKVRRITECGNNAQGDVPASSQPPSRVVEVRAGT